MLQPSPNLGLRNLSPTELPHAFNSDTITKIEMAAVTRLKQTTPTGASGEYEPPADPEFQDAYYVQTGASGTVWEGASEAVAYWTGGSWRFIQLRTGWSAFDIQAGVNKTYRYDETTQSGAWVEFNEVLTLSRNIGRLFDNDRRCTAGISQLRTKDQPLAAWDYRYQVGILSDRDRGVYQSPTNPLFSFANGAGTFTTAFNAAIYDRATFQNTHMLYRYVGNVNRQGDPSQLTPRILGGTLSISSNTGTLRTLGPTAIYLIAAQSSDSFEVNNTRTTPTGDPYDVLGDDMATDFPELPTGHTRLWGINGFNEVPSSGAPDYDYVREFTIPPVQLPTLQEGTIVLRTYSPGFTDPASTQEDVDISVQLTLDNSF